MSSEAPAHHDIHIVMVNAGMNLGCALDLNSINRQVKNTVYEPSNLRSMPQVKLYLTRTRAVVSISANGHVDIVGAKSAQDAKRGLMVCARICQRLQFEVRPRDFKVSNMMAIARAGFRIDLKRLAETHREECRYDPDIVDGSPSLVYQMPMPASVGPPVQLAIWSAGTIRFQKCRSDEAMKRALSAIMTVLSDFREQ